MFDIALAVSAGLITLFIAYLGVHVTLHPAETSREKLRYKVCFAVCGILICTLIGVQTYRNNQTLARIDRNTQQPPRVQVTNNIPSPSVVFQSPALAPATKAHTVTKLSPSSDERLQAMTNAKLKLATFSCAKKMRDFEARMNRSLARAAPPMVITQDDSDDVIKPTSDNNSVDEKQKKIYLGNETEYNQTLLIDAVAFRNELRRRLGQIPSAYTNPNTGMEAFRAQPTEIAHINFEEHPIRDGADYLEMLARQLP